MVVEAPAGFMVSHLSRQNTYSTKSSFSPRLSDMNLLAPLQPIVLPRRLGRAAIEELLIKILHNQDSFTHDFWDLINSLGYRMDKTELEREKDRDRLWALEHPKAEKTCD